MNNYYSKTIAVHYDSLTLILKIDAFTSDSEN
jgi:hypothetical protein